MNIRTIIASTKGRLEKPTPAIRAEVGLRKDHPFMVRMPASDEDEKNEGARRSGGIASIRVVHFRSLDELMECVLETLTESKVAASHSVIGEQSERRTL